jgi:hypothetical protein
LDQLISTGKIYPALDSARHRGRAPTWAALTASVAGEYGETYAKRTVNAAKIIWYGEHKQWNEFSAAIADKLDNTGGDHLDGFNLDNDCWTIFEHSSNPLILNRAAVWLEKLFASRPEQLGSSATLDTYANLLYRSGRTKEALEWESKAVAAAPDDVETMKNFTAMKAGAHTWKVNAMQ